MEFEVEYNKYKNDMYRLAYSYTLNRQDAEDIIQKSFIQLYNNFDKFSDSENIKHWLVVVTINQCKNLTISHWKNKIFYPENLEDYDTSYQDNYTLIYSTISKLKKSYRIPFYLNLIYGYTSKEIANIMGLTEGTIKMRIKRAKETLKLFWEENK